MNFDGKPAHDYSPLHIAITDEMMSQHGLTLLQAINYLWTIFARGCAHDSGNYEKLDH